MFISVRAECEMFLLLESVVFCMDIEKGDEFRVMSYWGVGIPANTYLRVDEISADDYVSFSNDSTQLNFDIPLERVIAAREKDILIESERDSQMHD